MKVLLIIARGLRADYLGCYGNPRVETPALDTLAATGIVFDRHFADAADPAGAHSSWRSGRYLFPGPAPVAEADLVALLSAHGVATAAVIDTSRQSAGNWHNGWQSTEALTASADETALERTVAAARAQLTRLKAVDRWLVAVELATALPPWDVPSDFREHYFRDEVIDEEEADDEEAAEVEVEPLSPLPDPPAGAVDVRDDTLYLRLQGSYAGAVTYLDAGIAELIRGVADDVLVLVTSDSGYALGEHGFVGPGLTWPAGTVMQLPLLLRPPGRCEPGLRVPALTQTVDLAPTLAALFEIRLPDIHGHDLGPLIRCEAESVRPYAVSRISVGENSGMSVRSPEWSVVIPAGTDTLATPRLYIRPEDHWEVNDVRQHHLELAEALEKMVRDFEQAARQAGPLVTPPLPDLEATEPPAE